MATITGDEGNNPLTGGAGNDLLKGFAGNDTLDGGAGADTLDGGVGNDTFILDNFGDTIIEAFGGGTDTVRTALLDPLSTFSLAPFTYVENLVYTGSVAAQLKGNAQNNEIRANSAAATADTLYGAGGNDNLFGFGGSDSLIGGSGNDSLDGGAGADRMVGGTGNDNYVVDHASDRVYEYAFGGFDTISSALLKDLRQPWSGQVEGLAYTGAAAALLHGNALGNLVTSTSAGADTINGWAGDDTLDGGGGADSMLGGDGNDTYRVSSADIVSEAVGAGIDSFIGGKVTINVAPYATTIENLFYTGATGAALSGNAMDNVVAGGSGADTVSGLDGADSLAGGTGADSLLGGTGDDDLYGGAVTAGAYVGMAPDSAVDTLVGGAGDDLYWIDALADGVTELAAGGTRDTVNSAIDNSLSRYANVEALVLRSGTEAWFGGGSTRADILVGNGADNYLVGGAGNDTLAGSVDNLTFSGAASDVLDGGDGDDVLIAYFFSNVFLQETTLFGGLGDDLYVVGTSFLDVGGQDSGGSDTAVLVGGGSIEALEGVENLVLYGAGGSFDTRARAAIDAVWGAANRGDPFPNVLAPALNGTGNLLANTITGNSQSNNLAGLAGNDTITGGAGNDTLDGGTGTDNLSGGEGNDTYVVDGADVVVEGGGAGFDLISSATLTSTAGYANVEGLIYTGSTGVALDNGAANVTNDYFTGGSGNDTLRGYGGNDTLDGAAGNDSVLGDAGLDSLLGAAGNDTLDGGADNDTLQGGAGADRVSGGAGNDVLYGNLIVGFVADSGANTMFGNEGNDTLRGAELADALSGDAGNDLLVGGAGNDVLSGGTVTNSALYFSAAGDVLWGHTEFSGQGATDNDQFRLGAPTADNHAVETSPASGLFYFNTGTLVADFASGSDVIRFAASMVGDNDTALEGVTVKADAGGTFASTAEMVIFRSDAVATFNAGPSALVAFAATTATTVIGSADAAFAVGAERLFVIDNGGSSAILQFTAANADALVTVDELSLLAVVNGNAALGASDFSLF